MAWTRGAGGRRAAGSGRTVLGRAVALAVVTAAALLPAPSAPAQRQDQEEARRAREAGRILDYGEIRRRALKAVPGRIVDQDLRRRDKGRYVYRLKILRADGKVAVVMVDAHSGRIIAVRRP